MEQPTNNENKITTTTITTTTITTSIGTSDADIKAQIRQQVDDRRKVHELHWYTLYVQMNHERKVADKLREAGFEIFVPTKRELRQWSDRKRWVDIVLTPRMLFVRLAMADKQRVFVSPKVRYFMKAPGDKGPTPILDAQMATFRSMIELSADQVQMLENPLQKGDKVRVIRGNFIGMVGELLRKDSGSEIMVRLNEALAATVKVDIADVEKMVE